MGNRLNQVYLENGRQSGMCVNWNVLVCLFVCLLYCRGRSIQSRDLEPKLSCFYHIFTAIYDTEIKENKTSYCREK